MSREIKFRAWDMWSLVMTEAEGLNGVYVMLNPANNDDEGNHSYELQYKLFDDNSGKIEANIMQYTGLKDKNGDEIYEGDIIGYIDGKELSEVYYCENEAMYKIKLASGNEIGIYILSTFSKVFEVIGNIHENQDML